MANWRNPRKFSFDLKVVSEGCEVRNYWRVVCFILANRLRFGPSFGFCESREGDTGLLRQGLSVGCVRLIT